MPTTTTKTSNLRQSTGRAGRPPTDLHEAATRAEHMRRLQSASKSSARIGTSERSPVRRLATLVSARPYLDVNG